MKVLIYTVLLEQPLLATSLEGDPNSSRSYDYLPGSQIRGLLIHRYRARPGAAELLDDAVALRRFFRGEVRFLHAYPALADGTRALPTPLSLRKPKGADNAYTLFNAAHAEGARGLRAAEVQDVATQWQPVGAPFCAPAAGALRLHSPDHTVAIHIQRDRVAGRPRRLEPAGTTEAEQGSGGAIFRYDALAAEQRFGGAILCDEDEDADALKQLIDADPLAWMGRSRSAGYGRVQLAATAAPADWRETGAPLASGGDRLTLTLLSDGLLRDKQGRELLGTDIAALNETLGEIFGLPVCVEPTASFTATTLAGSYNTTARLPGVQRHALRAGSVITLALDRPLSADALMKLEQHGLGERRAEGYGRFAFSWLDQPQLAAEHSKPARAASSVPADRPSLSPASARLAAQMAGRLLAQRIDQEIGRFAQAHRPTAQADLDRWPQSSQLGRVRVLIRRALPAGDTAAVRAGLAGMKRAGAAQFERARLGNQSLGEWLDALLAPSAAPAAAPVWAELGIAPADDALQVARTAPPVDALLANRTALRLAEALLSAAARERRPKEAAK